MIDVVNIADAEKTREISPAEFLLTPSRCNFSKSFALVNRTSVHETDVDLCRLH